MSIPASVLDAFGFSTNRIEVVTGGLINATYCVYGGGANQALAAVQRLHPVFKPEVNYDLAAVTDHLAGKAMVTPRLVRTGDGKAWVEVGGDIWRAITWVPGSCYGRVPNPAVASAAAELVGRFHTAVSDLEYDFQGSRTGVHDTAAHFSRLEKAVASDDVSVVSQADELRTSIVSQAEHLPPMPELPARICHGDLKISNILFDGAEQGLCLIDLDTLGPQTLAFELGDALRSWANPTGEDVAEPAIDIDIVRAAGHGYARGAAGLMSPDEIDSIIVGLETVCIELAARFCCDAFEDSYFGWDPTRFASRPEHNLLRARGQLALGKSVAQKRAAIRRAWAESF